MFPYDAGRKPGRPKAVPEATVPKVIALYKQGLGYRAISSELKKENLSANWSTVRRPIKNKLRTNHSHIFERCYYVEPSHSINIDRYRHGIDFAYTPLVSSKLAGVVNAPLGH